jgi:hypothetical protein
VADDIATLAEEWTRAECRKNMAFNIALEVMIEACKRHGNHAELAKFLGHYQTCSLYAGVNSSASSWDEAIAWVEAESDALEKCAERIGCTFREDTYAMAAA